MDAAQRGAEIKAGGGPTGPLGRAQRVDQSAPAPTGPSERLPGTKRD